MGYSKEEIAALSFEDLEKFFGKPYIITQLFGKVQQGNQAAFYDLITVPQFKAAIDLTTGKPKLDSKGEPVTIEIAPTYKEWTPELEAEFIKGATELEVRGESKTSLVEKQMNIFNIDMIELQRKQAAGEITPPEFFKQFTAYMAEAQSISDAIAKKERGPRATKAAALTTEEAPAS